VKEKEENIQHNKENKENELQQIRDALNILNAHKFVRLYNSTFKMLWFQFLKGLGSVIGATIVVSIVISLLGQIEFIPIIGEWAKELMAEIQQSQQ